MHCEGVSQCQNKVNPLDLPCKCSQNKVSAKYTKITWQRKVTPTWRKNIVYLLCFAKLFVAYFVLRYQSDTFYCTIIISWKKVNATVLQWIPKQTDINLYFNQNLLLFIHLLIQPTCLLKCQMSLRHLWKIFRYKEISLIQVIFDLCNPWNPPTPVYSAYPYLLIETQYYFLN